MRDLVQEKRQGQDANFGLRYCG